MKTYTFLCTIHFKSVTLQLKASCSRQGTATVMLVHNHSLNFHSCRHIGHCCWTCWELSHLRMQCIWKQWEHWPQTSGQSSPGTLPATYRYQHFYIHFNSTTSEPIWTNHAFQWAVWVWMFAVLQLKGLQLIKRYVDQNTGNRYSLKRLDMCWSIPCKVSTVVLSTYSLDSIHWMTSCRSHSSRRWPPTTRTPRRSTAWLSPSSPVFSS